MAQRVATADRHIHLNELSTLKLLRLISIVPPVTGTSSASS
jgi:hypothetical protein